MHHIRSRITIATIGILVAVVASGCSSGDPTPTSTTSAAAMPEEMTKVRVGHLTIPQLGALQVGIDEGIFAAHNLEIEFVPLTSTDGVVTSLASQDIDFGTLDPVTEAVAISQGITVGWVTSLFTTAPEENATGAGATFVSPDSTLNSYKDLEGKKVGVNCERCLATLAMLGAVLGDGGDPSKVETVLIQGPTNLLPALEQGQVDAVPLTAAYAVQAIDAGFTKLGGDPYYATARSIPIAPFATNTTWADQNPSVVNAFVASIEEISDLVLDDPDAANEGVAKMFPNIAESVEAASKITKNYSACFNKDSLTKVLSVAQTLGWLDDSFTYDQWFWSGRAANEC